MTEPSLGERDRLAALPCPWCPKPYHPVLAICDGGYTALCGNCGARGPIEPSREAAVERWNKRAGVTLKDPGVPTKAACEHCGETWAKHDAMYCRPRANDPCDLCGRSGAPIRTEGIREAAQRLVDALRPFNSAFLQRNHGTLWKAFEELEAALASAPLPDTVDDKGYFYACKCREGWPAMTGAPLPDTEPDSLRAAALLLEAEEWLHEIRMLTPEARARLTTLQAKIAAFRLAPLGERNTPEAGLLPSMWEDEMVARDIAANVRTGPAPQPPSRSFGELGVDPDWKRGTVEAAPEGTRLAVMQCCGFSFDAVHQDEGGGYSCPCCSPTPEGRPAT